MIFNLNLAEVSMTILDRPPLLYYLKLTDEQTPSPSTVSMTYPSYIAFLEAPAPKPRGQGGTRWKRRPSMFFVIRADHQVSLELKTRLYDCKV